MDEKGIEKFGALGSVSLSVNLIWLTLCDSKLAEELSDPPPLEVVMEVTGKYTHAYDHLWQTQYPTLQLVFLQLTILLLIMPECT